MCCGKFAWKKIEFWFSIVHIFLMTAAGVVSLHGLVEFGDIVYYEERGTLTIIRGEIIAIGTLCFLGEFLDIGPYDRV